MKKMKHVVLLCCLMWVAALPALRAQDKEMMAHYQSELSELFAQAFTAPTDNERYHANESAIQLLAEALTADNSFRWQWDFGNGVSVLTASDKKFRIFTWPIVNDAGEYECFGFVQALNERTKQYDVTQLNDRSLDIINRQEEVLGPDRWYGAVYQDLIVTTHQGRTFYTLLGWNGVDKLTQRKIIEPICFKSGGSTPQFGQNIFRKEPNLRRIVLEYKHDAMVNLSYEEQYLHLTERVRPRRSSGFSLGSFFSNLFSSPSRSRRRGRGRGRASRPVATAARTSAAVKSNNKNRPTYKTTDKKQLMIIFDQVAPQVPGMEGLYQYYVPSGVEMAYLFNDGKWELYDTAQGRDPNKKLNKEFEPMEKPAPAYQVEQTH